MPASGLKLHSHLIRICVVCPSSTVVYEGCPKAFDAGIWWPKTKFGRPAAMNCPKGSIGECFEDKSNMWSNYMDSYDCVMDLLF